MTIIKSSSVTQRQYHSLLVENQRLTRLVEARLSWDMLIESSCHTLPLSEQKSAKRLYVEWKNIGHILNEAQLTTDQINQIFTDVEKQVSATGGNRTLAGKAVDVAGSLGRGLAKVRDAISNTGPVSGFDVLIDQVKGGLLKAAGGESGVVGRALDKYKEIGVKYPVTQKAIYAGLIALSGLSAAGATGIAVVAAIKTLDGLFKGKKFSTAVMDSLPGAAVSWIMQHLPSNTVPGVQQADNSEMIRANQDVVGGSTSGPQPDDTTGLARASDDVVGGSTSGVDNAQPDAGQVPEPENTPSVELNTPLEKAYGAKIPEYTGRFGEAFKAARENLGPGKLFAWNNDVYPTNFREEGFYTGFTDQIKDMLKKGIKEAAYTLTVLPYSKLVDVNRTAKAIQENSKWEYHPTSIHFSPQGVANLFENVSGLQNYLVEAGFWRGVGSALGRGAQAVAGGIEKAGQFAGRIGHSVTNKITTDKLMMNWKAAGKPTDSSELLKFLLKQGVNRQVISSVYKKMGIPVTNVTAEPFDISKYPLPDSLKPYVGNKDILKALDNWQYSPATSGSATRAVGPSPARSAYGAGQGSPRQSITQPAANHNIPSNLKTLASTSQGKADLLAAINKVLAS